VLACLLVCFCFALFVCVHVLSVLGVLGFDMQRAFQALWSEVLN